MKDIYVNYSYYMYDNKVYETSIVAGPDDCDVTIQRVYKLLEEIKETYCRRCKINYKGEREWKNT